MRSPRLKVQTAFILRENDWKGSKNSKMGSVCHVLNIKSSLKPQLMVCFLQLSLEECSFNMCKRDIHCAEPICLCLHSSCQTTVVVNLDVAYISL